MVTNGQKTDQFNKNTLIKTGGLTGLVFFLEGHRCGGRDNFVESAQAETLQRNIKLMRSYLVK